MKLIDLSYLGRFIKRKKNWGSPKGVRISLGFKKAGSGNDAQPIYFSDRSVPPAEAVITQVNGNLVDFWLGGVSPQALAAFNRDAIFQLVDNDGVEQGKIQLKSRNALSCQGQVLEIARPELLKPPVKPG